MRVFEGAFLSYFPILKGREPMCSHKFSKSPRVAIEMMVERGRGSILVETHLITVLYLFIYTYYTYLGDVWMDMIQKLLRFLCSVPCFHTPLIDRWSSEFTGGHQLPEQNCTRCSYGEYSHPWLMALWNELYAVIYRDKTHHIKHSEFFPMNWFLDFPLFNYPPSWDNHLLDRCKSIFRPSLLFCNDFS